MSMCRGIRGATTVDNNTREDIVFETRLLLSELVAVNDIDVADIASAFFTTSPDLNAEFPAVAARELGWRSVALMCGHEMSVPHGLQKCIRVLIHWNTDKPAAEIKHRYLKGAAKLRPDLTGHLPDKEE
jgi:chorismate mutase